MTTLAALRAMTAEQIQDAAAKLQGIRFRTAMDGYFLSKSLAEIFEAGEQAKIPLLEGSNTQEQPARSVLGTGDPTPETLANAIRRFYGDKADPVLKAYTAGTTDEVYEAATHLASARFISYGTWKWAELQMKTGGKPVYRYLYARPRPAYLGMPGESLLRRQRLRPAGAATATAEPPSNLRRPVARRIRLRSNTPWATWISTSATPGSPPTSKYLKRCRPTS